ncbi:MAG: DUF262 domain-containing protein [Olegusella sp.]|nr:DUF262 domain-containing protein [Olegusella sp.]
MHADTATIVGLVTPVNLRFVVPVYQRPYTWDIKQCAQLWDDVLSVGRAAQEARMRSAYGSREVPTYHFTGSIVWIQDGAVSPAGVESRLLIDGQQRITTLMLVFVALVRYAQRHPEKAKALVWSAQEILDDGYLTNKHRSGDDHYKLTLSKGDREVFQALVDGLEQAGAADGTAASAGTAATPSASGELADAMSVFAASAPTAPSHLLDNLAFFESELERVPDPNVVWLGLQHLQVASIALTEGQDNPQLVFESMNSTGKDLSVADLVRNFILMSAPVESQASLYRTFWRPIEEALGADAGSALFDGFLHDWLTAIRAPQQFDVADIYGAFKRYVRTGGYDTHSGVVALINQLRRFVRYYAHITTGEPVPGRDSAAEVDEALAGLRALGEPRVYPMLLSFYDAYDQQDIDRDTFVRVLRVTESYVLRRLVCDCPGDDFALYLSGIIGRLDGVRAVGGDYATAYESYLLNAEGTALRFPTDDEFARAVSLRDAADWDEGSPIGRALAAGEDACRRWPYPAVDERTRAIYRASR